MRSRFTFGLTLFMGVTLLLALGALTERPAQADTPPLTLEDLAKRLDRLEAATRQEEPRARSSAELARALLRPSVQVHAKGGAGGGTLIYSKPDATYLLTAFHVVAKAVMKDEDGREHRLPVRVTIYDAEGLVDEMVEGDLTLWHEKKDIALVRLRTTRIYPTAQRAQPTTLARLDVFTPVYAVGCPLGHDPLPSSGEISTRRKIVQGERFWMMNAPTIFGNSGGGVFDKATLEFIGVSTMICTVDGASSTPVPHLGIFTPLCSIQEWLATHGYGTLFEPDAKSNVIARKEW